VGVALHEIAVIHCWKDVFVGARFLLSLDSVRSGMSRGDSMPSSRLQGGGHPGDTLRNYYSVVFRRRWLVPTVTLAVSSIVVIAGCLQTPMYKAASLLKFNRGQVNVVQELVDDHQLVAFYYWYLTQETLLHSRTMAGRVAERLQLWEHPLYSQALERRGVSDREEAQKAIEKHLLSMMRVRHLPRTLLTEVAFLTPDPEHSAQLANALVDEYLLYRAETEAEVSQSVLSVLHDTVEELKGDIIANEERIRERDGTGLSSRGEAGGVVDVAAQRLRELTGRLAEAEAERAKVEAYYYGVSNAEPATLPDVRNSESVRRLEEQYSELRQRVADLSSTFGSEWPELQRLSARKEELRRSLDEAIRRETETVIAASRTAYQEAREREALERRYVIGHMDEMASQGRRPAEHERIARELEQEREMLPELLRQESEAEISTDLRRRPSYRVQVVQRADVPESPTSPNLPMMPLAGGLAAFCLAIGLAFGLNCLDNTVRTDDDLRQEGGPPYLGMIPHLTSQPRGWLLGEGRARPKTPTGAVSPAVLRERFRFLCGSLRLGARAVVLVTSPGKDDGKSFVACNLGVALARAGKRVLLVDADLRNPSLHRVFKRRSRVGLTSLLTGRKTLSDGYVVTTGLANLFLLTGGPMGSSPGELAVSPAMREALESCAREFDFVIVDSAPLLPVFDTHPLTTQCDAVVLVTRSGATRRLAYKASLDLIEQVKGKITGVVLNDVTLSAESRRAHGDYHCRDEIRPSAHRRRVHSF
jgi:capsular exopolysaccharide synthesis family protein